jgi:hypothetical protein
MCFPNYEAVPGYLHDYLKAVDVEDFWQHNRDGSLTIYYCSRNSENPLNSISHTIENWPGPLGVRHPHPRVLGFVNSTISKDKTMGEEVRNSCLLAGFGKWIQRRGLGELSGGS